MCNFNFLYESQNRTANELDIVLKLRHFCNFRTWALHSKHHFMFMLRYKPQHSELLIHFNCISFEFHLSINKFHKFHGTFLQPKYFDVSRTTHSSTKPDFDLFIYLLDFKYVENNVVRPQEIDLFYYIMWKRWCIKMLFYNTYLYNYENW